jgi:glycosyltransferase involved in cell wall biosynthesis
MDKGKDIIFYTVIDPSGRDNTSGGPQTAMNMINHVRNLGFNVTICTPGKEFINPDSSLFNIYHDIYNDPGGSKWFSVDQQYKLLGSSSPYMFSECAYTGCIASPYGEGSHELNQISSVTRAFVAGASVSVFASPLHSEEFKSFLHLDRDVNTFIYPREVDTSMFTDFGIDRDIEYLTVGAINHWKGTDIVVSKYRHSNLHVAGYGSTLPSGATNLGRVPHKDLPELYNRSKNFVHLPRWKEAFGRTVAEASLCGCNIIGNKNVGALSCEGDLSTPDFYQKSRKRFISMIKETFLEG